MTRRERLERKLELRKEWADKAAARSDSRFTAAGAIADHIPLGQPILVGHHSERHARRDAERIHNNMSKGCEEAHLAEHHQEKASGIAAQLETSIFSDDNDAIEALEARILEREAKAEKMVATNKAWRQSKGDVDKFAELASLSLQTAQRIANTIAGAYSWEKQPYPAYELSNLRSSLRRDKERIKEIMQRQERSAKADAAGGTVIEGDEWVRITFAEKPDRSILDALKAAGFRWGAGSWSGKRENLPEEVQA